MNPETLLGDDYVVFSKQSVQESVNLTSIIVKDAEVMSYFDNRNTVFFCVFCLIMKYHYDRLLTDKSTEEVIRLNALVLETTKEISRKMGISFDENNNPLFSKYVFISKSVDRILEDKVKLGLEGDDLFCYVLSVLLSVEASLDKEKAFEFSVKFFSSPNFEEMKKLLIESTVVQVSKNPERSQEADSIEIINSYRAADIKQLLIQRGVNLPEEDYQLYGNMFEIMALFTNGKADNQTMVNVFDQLSDLLLGKKPEFAAIITKDQVISVQLRYMNEKNLLSGFTDKEKELFAYCVWHATLTAVTDKNGDIKSGLIDFDSLNHIKTLYEEDKRRCPECFIKEKRNETGNVQIGRYGYSADNPVHTTSIGASYELIKNLLYMGEQVEISSRSSVSSNNHRIIDAYSLITKSGKQIKIFIDPYSLDNSKEMPEGFASKETPANFNGDDHIVPNNSIIETNEGNDEYKKACETVERLNHSLSFATKPGFAAGFGNSNLAYLNRLIGNPKELGEEMIKVLNNELTQKYYELLNEYENTKSSDAAVEISDLLHEASAQIRKLQHGNTPIDQWEFEMYCSPQLYWALEAANQGNVEGYVREQRYLKFRGKDSINCPEDLIKSIQLKFAYEGDSDMQYALYKRYDPTEEHFFNGPAINKAEKSQSAADFWLDKLAHNPNIKIENKWVLDLLVDQKTPEVEKAMKKAAELDDPEYYYTIAEFFGTDTDIGFNLHKKNAFSGESFKSTSCKRILEHYKKKGDKINFKSFLMEWIKNAPDKDKWFGGVCLYRDNYDLFRWLDDPAFDAEYLDYIINNGDSFWAKSAKEQKAKHLNTSLFSSKVSRKD